ncbi:E3 ubiquitin-protein ligase RNF170-like [Xiphophorus maculatus]|nr:E3 ubiquitin-protein ligase RNF170-like [Xiphophorus maculatus]
MAPISCTLGKRQVLSGSTSLPARKQRLYLSLLNTSAFARTATLLHTSQSRLLHLQPEDLVGQDHLASSTASTCTSERLTMCASCHKESTQSGPSMSSRDSHCPVCLQTATFPVQTNCGHLFCANCLLTYWRHGSWLDAVSCPLCRQKVSVLCNLFKESRSDQQSKKVLGEITDYNKRYSGAPRRVTDYLCDAPLLLQLLARNCLGTMGGLVWLFLFRVALCCVGTVVSISSSPSVDSAPSSTPLETDPSLCGLLGVLDDLVVVILLLLCVINVNQQIAPDGGRHSPNRTTSQGVMGSSL